jgi:hypothetical protein
VTAPPEPAPAPVPEPPTEPEARDWDETPAEAARYDDAHWADRDWDDEPDDPTDHYYC